MHDIAIIGAGPAGATLARLLGSSYRVLLIDRRAFSPNDHSRGKCCGGLLAPDAQKMLSRLGYVAVAAQSGMEAVEILKRRKEDVRLVLLDMIMPKMSGSETFDAVKAIQADIKVVLSSGYSLNGQAEEIMARGCDGFIQKPFNLEQLSEKLRQVLDQ